MKAYPHSRPCALSLFFFLPGPAQFLEQRSVPRAVLTRNQREAVDHLVRVSGTSFVATITREFTPVKPSPAPLLHICERILVRL